MSDISDDAKSLGGGVGSDGTGAGYLSTRAGQEALDELLAKEKPLQQWQEMRQAGTLTADDIVQYFKRATPYLFNLDSARCDADLGEYALYTYVMTVTKLDVWGGKWEWFDVLLLSKR